MKALAVSRNSWIYKLAKFGGFEESWSGSTSICELNTAIMFGVSRILGFALVIAFFGFFMLTPVYYGFYTSSTLPTILLLLVPKHLLLDLC